MIVAKGSIKYTQHTSANEARSPYWKVVWLELVVGPSRRWEHFDNEDKMLEFVAKLYLQEEQ